MGARTRGGSGGAERETGAAEGEAGSVAVAGRSAAAVGGSSGAANAARIAGDPCWLLCVGVLAPTETNATFGSF